MIMDTMMTRDLVQHLGVSLPTVHRMLDREGVPRTGRGIPRRVPIRVYRHLLRRHTPLLSRHQVLVLGAVRSRIHGVGSAREIARLVKISPSTAGKILRQLMDSGLIVHRMVNTMWAGAVVQRSKYQIDLAHRDWLAIRPVVDQVEITQAPIKKSRTIPKQFWHLFWNATPAELRTDQHGVYIARRMLTADDLDPALWALANISADDITEAVRGRGMDKKTRAFVINHLQSQGEAA